MSDPPKTPQTRERDQQKFLPRRQLGKLQLGHFRRGSYIGCRGVAQLGGLVKGSLGQHEWSGCQDEWSGWPKSSYRSASCKSPAKKKFFGHVQRIQNNAAGFVYALPPPPQQQLLLSINEYVSYFPIHSWLLLSIQDLVVDVQMSNI